MQFDTPIQFVKGVGPQFGGVLAKLGIRTVGDFWFFFPKRYEDRRNPVAYASLKPNEVQSVLGQVLECRAHSTPSGRSILRCRLSDGRYAIDAVWFNQPFLEYHLKPGKWVWLSGKWEFNTYAQTWELSVSETEIAASDQFREHFGIGQVVPIYPLTAGVSAFRIRGLARLLVNPAGLSTLVDPMPESIRQAYQLPGLSASILELHFPTQRESYYAAKRRLVFDDFFYFQVSLAQKRVQWRFVPKAPVLSPPGPLHKAYLEKLPYTLTKGQLKAIEDIYQDLTQPTRMNRLLQGDVGCGKTDVAVLTLLAAVDSGYSASVMVPTEILAQQHYSRLDRYVSSLGVEVVLLKGSLTAKTRRKCLVKLLESSPKILVGTHALLEGDVQIPNLGVVIIDEQHRFGVDQRMKLQEKGMYPHGLFMTATPIPRSLMLTCFGDLNKTIISEMPPGRVPIHTQWVMESRVDALYSHCRISLQQGRQLYVVYPLVEESAKLDLKSAIEGWELLTQTVFADFKVGLLHGRMKSDDKQQVMAAFSAGEIQVLVSTTVIEVGVDVPNATMMIIQHADRFGLAQLHQLRGRVGRGRHAGSCYLITGSEGKDNPRIKAMVSTQDGFKLSEIDLTIRGPGDLLGRRQSGLPIFKVADLVKDTAILQEARQAGFSVIAQDPTLNLTIHQALRYHVLALYGETSQPN